MPIELIVLEGSSMQGLHYLAKEGLFFKLSIFIYLIGIFYLLIIVL